MARLRGACGAVTACALAAQLAACTVVRLQVGSPVRADPFAELHEGQTTQAQVLERFGPPDAIARYRQGEVFSYRYRSRAFRSFALSDPVATGLALLRYSTEQDERSERLVVLFDPRGVVSGFGYRPGGAAPQGPGGAAPQGPGGAAPQGPGGAAPQGPGGAAPQGPEGAPARPAAPPQPAPLPAYSAGAAGR